MDAVSESRLSQVYPILADKIRQMAVQLQAQNILIRVVQGLRTSAQQDALYAQGRTQPGNVVTNCPGGHSYHNFGLAVDCVPSINGFEMLYAPDWNASHPAWKAMIAAGEGLGWFPARNGRLSRIIPTFSLPEGSLTERRMTNCARSPRLKAYRQFGMR